MGRRIEDKRCKNRSGENPPHLAIGAHPEEIGVTKHLFLKYGFENRPKKGVHLTRPGVMMYCNSN